MMRIGVLSDTHIPDRAKDIPNQVLRNFKNVEMIIHAGDLVDLSVLDKLKEICPKVWAVWGNMDSYEVRKKLPEKLVFTIGNYKVGVMHGSGFPYRLTDLMAKSFKDDEVKLIIFGHSHFALNEKIGNVVYFNPGSPTDKIFSPYNSYGIVEINDEIKTKIIRI